MATQQMTKSRWLEKVADNAVVLRRLIADWHPSARKPRAIQRESVLLSGGTAVAIPVPESAMEITAPAAEQACQRIRMEIRQKEPQDPLQRWDKAVAAGNIDEINTLLNDAWFGVPESTSCWSITGFKEAVELMEDLPEE